MERATFIMADDYITMVRGDTLAFGMEIAGLDQSLDTAFFTVKKELDGDITFQKSLGDGIEDAGGGQYTIRVAPEDTASLDSGQYWYDLQIGVNSDVYTVKRGILELEMDLT